MDLYKLAIITSHPIQYNVPFFRKIAESKKIQLKVFFTWGKKSGENHDPGFGKNITWDIPLLEGYDYIFVKNTSKNPGSNKFLGIQNPSLNREVKAFRPDAILVYGWNFRSHLQAMQYFKGKTPVWFRGDSTLLSYNIRSLTDLIKTIVQNKPSKYPLLLNQYFKFFFRNLLLTWVYKNIDKAFCVGTNNKNYFLTHGVKENQLVLLPHAVDNEFFQRNEENAKAEATEWRKKIGIGENDFVILYAGKFEPVKNIELLLNAVIELNEEVDRNRHIPSPIRLILVGSGILEPKLKEMAKGKNYIHFLPFQNQSKMPITYRLGNVFCLPSKSETWGLGINEAMACSISVIVSDKVGCAVDLVIKGVTGFVFKNNSIVDLKNKIKTAAISTDTKEMGNYCKKFIQNWNYNSQCLFDQFK